MNVYHLYCAIRQHFCHLSSRLIHKLYRNQGNGTFVDVTVAAGLARDFGPALGNASADFNNDGWIDLFVANDQMENQLWINQQDGTFQNMALLSGAALGAGGNAKADMGVDAGDFDNDGDSDTFVANGHVLDNVEEGSDVALYKQPNQILDNQSGQFVDVSADAGTGMKIVKASRGLASGDLDNDGDIDVLVGNVTDSPDLLINQTEGNHWLQIDLVGGAGRAEVGTWSNRDGIGARITIKTPQSRQVKDLHSAASYQSANDLRVHFGLGTAEVCDVMVEWPSGRKSELEGTAADQLIVIDEMTGGK